MKKVLASLILLLTATLLIACKDEKGVTTDFKPNIEIGYQENDSKNHVTKNLILPTSVNGYPDTIITWESDNDALEISGNTGIVNRKETDTEVVLTAKFNWEKKTQSLNYNITVIALPTIEYDFDEIYAKINIPNEVSKDITLPTTIDEAILIWSSNNPEVLSNEGVVDQKEEDVIVTLTVTVDINGVEESKDYYITVLKKISPPDSTETPIIEARELNNGQDVKIHGVVTSLMTNGNFTIQDSTGAIAIFTNDNTKLKIGTEYIIEGTMGDFNGLTQIESPKIITTIGER